MQNNEASRLPEIIVFAGPNGSGKTTITKLAKTIGLYINADDIKASSHCTDLEEPFRIFKKRKNEYFFWENDYWTEDLIKKMVFKE